MKGKKWIWLLAVSAICLVAFVGCDKKSASSTEGKEEPTMETKKIEMYGKIGENVAINPAFSWQGVLPDERFSVLLKEESGDVIAEVETDEPLWEIDTALAYDKQYVISVTGKESGASVSQSFKTVSGSGSVNLSKATLTLCEPYKDHMVIQRGKEILVKGTTLPNALVAVEFHGASRYVVADASGAYQATLPAMEANATPSALKVRLPAGKSLSVTDVLVGDVYLFSGQSNMQFTFRDSIDENKAGAVDNAIEYDVRYYSMSTNTSVTPLDTLKNGKWFKINKKDSGYTYYSAIALMTGSMLGEALHEEGVPVGVVCAAQGNTHIGGWISKEYYSGPDESRNLYYNAMIYPLRAASFKGVVWYQGCNNSARGISYKSDLTALFANWRELFGDDALPFYVVQLPSYDGKDASNDYDFSYVREAQMKACEADENAYLIATCDGGEKENIHPREKAYICERLLKSILSTRYGAAYLPQGPTYLSHTREGDSVLVTLKNADGLYVKEGEAVKGFLLAGADGKYYAATATIEGTQIRVRSDKVDSPVYIKYGFSKCPFLNVYNKDGYLLSPFRTDVYNRNIDLLDYTDSAQYESHPDGSDVSHEIVTVGSETGLRITKAGDGLTFGSLKLYKWGAIGYDEVGLRLRVIGTNSGATILFRIVEGSWEIWAYSFTDEGEQTFTIPTSELTCVYNEQNGVIDYQKIMNLEVTLRNDGGAAAITILEARFIDIPKTAPGDFTITGERTDGDDFIIEYSRAAFADRYHVVIAAEGENPVFETTTAENRVAFNAAAYRTGKSYLVTVTAENDLGRKDAKNNGYATTLGCKYVINDFDYTEESELQAYIKSNMKMHEGLTATLDEKGVRLVSAGQGWEYFIFLLNPVGVNSGYDTLTFYLDAVDYSGSVILQLVDRGNYNNPYSYTLNLNAKKWGIYTIPLSAFKKGDDAFDGRALERIAFNFSDNNGGTIYLDNVELLK